VFRARFLLVLSAAALTAGVARAQEAGPVDLHQARAETPWYQRFTSASGLDADRGAGAEEAAIKPEWTLSQKWGVTVDVREAQRVERGRDGLRPDQTAVGAYYHFTPRVRLGGEVSLGARARAAGEKEAGEPGVRDPEAGVRIESAFRF